MAAGRAGGGIRNGGEGLKPSQTATDWKKGGGGGGFGARNGGIRVD